MQLVGATSGYPYSGPILTGALASARSSASGRRPILRRRGLSGGAAGQFGDQYKCLLSGPVVIRLRAFFVTPTTLKIDNARTWYSRVRPYRQRPTRGQDGDAARVRADARLGQGQALRLQGVHMKLLVPLVLVAAAASLAGGASGSRLHRTRSTICPRLDPVFTLEFGAWGGPGTARGASLRRGGHARLGSSSAGT